MAKTVFLELRHVAFSQSNFLAIVQDLCNLCRNSPSKKAQKGRGAENLDSEAGADFCGTGS